tara:strand:- start:375 stop:932 length:558 start_codon:yes stop_codon:yes gene_type:complete
MIDLLTDIIGNRDKAEVLSKSSWNALKVLSVQCLQGKPWKLTELQAKRLYSAMTLATWIHKEDFISDSSQIMRGLVSDMVAFDTEVMRVLFFSNGMGLLHKEDMFRGSKQYCIMDPRCVFRRAIQVAAKGIVIAHNHPSGNPEPSPQDIAITERFINVGELLQIPVLDHFIIGRRIISFKEEGLI